MAQLVLNHCHIHMCVSRSTPGCVTAAPTAGPVGEDGAEGPEPSPAGAVLLQHIAGGSVVSAQRQSRARARPTKAAARPEGGAATGLLIHYTSSRIQETLTYCRCRLQRWGSHQHLCTWLVLDVWLKGISTAQKASLGGLEWPPQSSG